MTIGKIGRFSFILVMFGAASLIGCGGDKKETNTRSDTTTGGVVTDSAQIQQVLDETLARWKRRDMAVLYDQEFEYFQDKISFDEYLQQEMIRKIEADSVVSLTAKKVTLFSRDSARVSIDAYLVGVTGTEYHYPDEFTMYFHRGRWIRPTMAIPAQQWQYDSLKRVADSAAEAENEGGSGS